MQTPNIISSGIIGTSAMTLFSYLVSEAKDKNFREPEILAILLKRLSKEISKPGSEITGWSLHYVVGFLFTTLYSHYWEKKKLKPSLSSGIGLGALSGLFGIMVWQLTFKLHPDPPYKNLKRYFGHLFVAHLIFGAFAAVGYKAVKPNILNEHNL